MDEVLCVQCRAPVPRPVRQTRSTRQKLDHDMADLFPPGFRAEQATFLEWVESESLAAPGLNGNRPRVRSAMLPFYRGVALVALSHPGHDRDCFVLLRDGRLIRDIAVDGSNEWLHRLNREAPLRLTSPRLVVLYVRTVFHFVFGRKAGNFRIVEDADEILWASYLADTPRDTLADLVIPVTYRGSNGSGIHNLLVTAMLDDALYRIEVIVSGEPDAGHVWLSDKTLLADELPIADNKRGQK